MSMRRTEGPTRDGRVVVTLPHSQVSVIPDSRIAFHWEARVTPRNGATSIPVEHRGDGVFPGLSTRGVRELIEQLERLG